MNLSVPFDVAMLAGMIENDAPAGILADWLEEQEIPDADVCLLYARDKAACEDLAPPWDVLPDMVRKSFTAEPDANWIRTGPVLRRDTHIFIKPCPCLGHTEVNVLGTIDFKYFDVELLPQRFRFASGENRIYWVGQCRGCRTVYWASEQAEGILPILSTTFPQALLAEWAMRKFNLILGFSVPESVAHAQEVNVGPGIIPVIPEFSAFVSCGKDVTHIRSRSLGECVRTVKRVSLSYLPVTRTLVADKPGLGFRKDLDDADYPERRVISYHTGDKLYRQTLRAQDFMPAELIWATVSMPVDVNIRRVNVSAGFTAGRGLKP